MNCDDCQDERMEEEPLSPRPRWQDAEQPGPETAKVWMDYINEVFAEYPNKALNMVAMITLVANKIRGLRPENYSRVALMLERFIHESPELELRKGNFGGVFRKSQAEMIKDRIQAIKPGTLPAPMPVPIAYIELVKMAGVPDMITGKIQDNYTCKGCGNTKLHSTNDKSCWSCGRRVGT